MGSVSRTFLAFQHDAKLRTLGTVVREVQPFAALREEQRQLFKGSGSAGDHVVVTDETIFHPQGGGQPSDEGCMTSAATAGAEEEEKVKFDVSAVRMDCVVDGRVLHLGRFSSSPSSSPSTFNPGDAVDQAIDADKRLLYSRLHTAGHVLGAAVRALLEKEIPGFDELKASHFPGTAACEFRGSIPGTWRGPIQEKVDAYVAAAMPVEVDWWDEADFRREGLERLIPADRSLLSPGEKFRVVKIVGAEVYPCGGTHVDTTELCGKVNVRKISRSKGDSRVSYALEEQ